MVTLEKGNLRVAVAKHGAEVKSVKKGDREYVWQADPTFWGRTSPVLFPFVGAVNNKIYRVNGREYAMGQHGFARDMDFELIEQKEDRCTFLLKSNLETKEKYPYDFALQISYVLEEDSFRVLWNVKNTGVEKMYFSIGAHPAFNCTFGDSYVTLEKAGKLLESFDNTVFGAGVLTQVHKVVTLEDNRLYYEEHTFDGDAYVLEGSQVDSVTLYDKNQKCIRVEFTSPLLGVWAPVGKTAPFVCIEPWYGCADTEGFSGDISERKWGNSLEVGEEFDAEYKVICY